MLDYNIDAILDYYIDAILDYNISAILDYYRVIQKECQK